VIRFWDTSALVKAFNRRESGHARAANLLTAGKSIHPMTSVIAAVELVAVLVRETRDRRLAEQAVEVLKSFYQLEFGESHRDFSIRLAFLGRTRGADTAIAAQALAVAAAGERLEFVSADRDQARLIRDEAKDRRWDVRLILLPS
jgi:predicted nucleic acid-binding protein